jgi:hypothetical protein
MILKGCLANPDNYDITGTWKKDSKIQKMPALPSPLSCLQREYRVAAINPEFLK